MQQDIQKEDFTNIKRSVSDEVLKERLALLDEKTPIDISYNKNLASVINYYLSKDEEYFQRIFSLGDFYFPMFESELIQRAVPLELKYLAVVESALNPQAKSPAGAVGLWQFMYQTGKAYGLEVNSYQDERMQPEQATKAAAAYLKDLHQIFDDWNLAIAAYNSGPGNVSKAIRRSGGLTDFWNIRYFLPRETAGYVPSFQAIMYIFEYADEHQISYRKPPVFRYATDTIHIKKSIQLSKLAMHYLLTSKRLSISIRLIIKISFLINLIKSNTYDCRLKQPGSLLAMKRKCMITLRLKKKKKKQKVRINPSFIGFNVVIF